MILEAMKRSKEGETKTSDVPTVDTVHYVPEPETRFSRWQVGGMLAGVVVVIAGVLTTIWPSEQTSRTTASSATYSAAPTISPSPEVVETIASVSQEVGQQAERPAVQQLRLMNRLEPRCLRASHCKSPQLRILSKRRLP